jgi:hypothetical protein
MNYDLNEMLHDCWFYHQGHRRAEDGTCAADGALLGSPEPCDVHGMGRRVELEQWLRTHEQPVSDLPD